MRSLIRLGLRVSPSALAILVCMQWSAVSIAQRASPALPSAGTLPGEPPPGTSVIQPREPQISPGVRVIERPEPQLPGATVVTGVQNFVLTANAPTPFVVALSWTAVSQATGYVVLRDGIAIAQLPAAARTFHDNTLSPGSRRRYVVQAQVPEPPVRFARGGTAVAVLPSTSVVDVETPPILPPSGVVAKVVGPDSVEISWQPRAGASGYTLVRNSTEYPIGPQPRPGSYTQYNVPHGTSTYALRTVYLKPDGQQTLSGASPTLSLRTGPVRVLAIGDSVMWGQGLRDPSKFKTKVAQWLGAQLNRHVDVTLLARSGAEVEPPAEPAGQTAWPHGEVPSSLPFIRDQAFVLGPQRVRKEDVDLILVDGCANDVNMKSILDPGVNAARIGTLTRQFCGEPMLRLLDDLARTYPASKIVVTGYFPIISPSSDLRAVTVLAAHVGALAPAAAAALGVPLDPVLTTVAGVITSESLRQHWIANSNTFHAISTSELLTASITGNSRAGGNRVEFVPVPFGANNAFAAPDSLLWPIPIAPHVQDEVYAERYAACRAVPPGADNIKCVEAAMAHPNVRGAQVYADAITARLAKYLPEWRTRFASTQASP